MQYYLCGRLFHNRIPFMKYLFFFGARLTPFIEIHSQNLVFFLVFP